MTGWMIPTGLFVPRNERERRVWYLGRQYVNVRWQGSKARATFLQHPPYPGHLYGSETLVWANWDARR